MSDPLSAVSLAIYAILAIPVLYLLVKHARPGLMGWLLLFVFCTLRIIGGALAVKSSSHSASASIISNIGLSPLLLAASGILQEATIYRTRNNSDTQKLASIFTVFFHMLVIAGVVLAAAGSSNLQKHHDQPLEMEKFQKMVKAGIVLLTISWAMLVAYAGLAFGTPPHARNNGSVARAGKVLLASIAFALIFIGIRVFYSLVALCTGWAYLNPTTGSIPIRVILGFLSELIAALIFVGAGFKTEDAAANVGTHSQGQGQGQDHEDGDKESYKLPAASGPPYVYNVSR